VAAGGHARADACDVLLDRREADEPHANVESGDR